MIRLLATRPLIGCVQRAGECRPGLVEHETESVEGRGLVEEQERRCRMRDVVPDWLGKDVMHGDGIADDLPELDEGE